MSRFRTACAFVLCTTLLTGVSPAQTAAPATAPTSRPVDQSTPQGTLKMFTMAARDGNGDAIRSVLAPESDQEKAVADIIATRVVAAVQLQRAASRFPGHEMNPTEIDRAMATAFNDIDAADVKTDGDNATLTTVSREPGVPGSAIPLRRKDGKWGMVMTGMMAPMGTNPGEFEQRLARARIETAAITELSAEIAAGKYNAMDEAGRVLQTRVQAAVAKLGGEQTKTSTQPSTTQPATAPTMN